MFGGPNLEGTPESAATTRDEKWAPGVLTGLAFDLLCNRSPPGSWECTNDHAGHCSIQNRDSDGPTSRRYMGVEIDLTHQIQLMRCQRV